MCGVVTRSDGDDEDDCDGRGSDEQWGIVYPQLHQRSEGANVCKGRSDRCTLCQCHLCRLSVRRHPVGKNAGTPKWLGAPHHSQNRHGEPQKIHVHSYLNLSELPHQKRVISHCCVAPNAVENLLSIVILVVVVRQVILESRPFCQVDESLAPTFSVRSFCCSGLCLSTGPPPTTDEAHCIGC
jgi:hypothetical protein